LNSAAEVARCRHLWERRSRRDRGVVGTCV